MQIENIHLISAQFLERGLDIVAQVFGFVFAWLGWVSLGGQLQAAFFPASLAREGFLFPVDVDAGGVDFVVALRLEVVEVLVEVVEGCDARGFAGVCAVGHQAQDDPGLAGGCYKRHFLVALEKFWGRKKEEEKGEKKGILSGGEEVK